MLERLSGKADIVGTVLGTEGLRIDDEHVDYVVVLGGDGTILAAARAIGERAIPIIGVNLGKLGFLAEFSVEELITHLERVTSDRSLISDRMMLQVHARGASFLAVNDVCVIAGSPFRMIELDCHINGQQLARLAGDGLILSTPTGSTAYNMSVGGPILLPSVPAIVVSPIASHSLSLTPIVVDCDSIIEVKMIRANEGTSLVIDGQVSSGLGQDDVIRVHRFEKDFRLVRNPQYAQWHTLVTKLRWGQGPSYNMAHP